MSTYKAECLVLRQLVIVYQDELRIANEILTVYDSTLGDTKVKLKALRKELAVERMKYAELLDESLLFVAFRLCLMLS